MCGGERWPWILAVVSTWPTLTSSPTPPHLGPVCHQCGPLNAAAGNLENTKMTFPREAKDTCTALSIRHTLGHVGVKTEGVFLLENRYK